MVPKEFQTFNESPQKYVSVSNILTLSVSWAFLSTPNYSCAKFDCLYSSISDINYDVINASSTAISKVLHMCVNQVLFRCENIVSLFDFLEC